MKRVFTIPSGKRAFRFARGCKATVRNRKNVVLVAMTDARASFPIPNDAVTIEIEGEDVKQSSVTWEV